MPSTRRATPFLLALLASASTGLAQIDADRFEDAMERFKAERAEFLASEGATFEGWMELINGALERTPVAEMGVHQLAQANALGLLQPEGARAAAIERVAALREEVEPDSVRAATLAVLDLTLRGVPTRTSRPEPQLQGDLLGAALGHPKLEQAIGEGHAVGLAAAIRGLANVEAWNQHREAILDLGEVLADAPPAMAAEARAYWSAVEELNPADERRERIRTSLVAMMRRALEATEDGQPAVAEPREREFIEGSLALMDGAAARGELVGHDAPAMEVLWSSDSAITSMADLEGKVVVLDFWATWCGPCLASFPNVRELQAHYEGKPVAIVGVTSHQGAIYNLGNDGPIDCQGQPEKEHELMPRFMEAHEVTWPVVFTRQDVYNPDYAIQGIPHMAIIDAQGVVRHNGLHPAEPLASKTSKIDALLEEAGVQPPNPPTP